MSLRRTPTSTGNRLKGTWSFWVKRNNLNGSSTSRYLFYANNGGSQANAVRFNDDDGGDSLRALFWNGTDNNAFINFDKLRDPSSWQHYLIVYDSTLSTFDNFSNNDQTLERIKIFVNGRRMIETGGNGTQNKGIVNANQLMTTWGNKGFVNALFATNTNANGALITTFDAFFVDGQALTPDVFGFYKEGKGYVSAGSTTATDFRPGQWVPKAPRTIKSEINRKGGFGVNGFYLPMNDSSNFGADFHTTPNSIITLKGENLPQPRNGAPDTTDAYVSQLREDSYKDYLVYAVPGIELENTNPELVTNGDFSNGTTGWTGLSGGSLSVEDGKLKITETTGAVDAYACNSTAITTEIGKRYTIKWTFHEGSNTSFTVRFGNSGNQTQEYQSNTGANGYGSYPDPGTYSFTFTATATTLNLSFIVNQASSYGYVSNVSVKEALAVRDYSADIKGSGTNKTITANKLAGVYTNVPSYYGSALQFDGDNYTDYIETPHSTDFNFGSGDFTVECWRYLDSFNVGGTYLAKYDGTIAGSDWYLGGQANGVESFYWYNGPANTLQSIQSSSNTTSLNQWDHIAACRKGNQISLFVNGVCVGTATTTISLNDNTEVVRAGADASGNYQMNGRLQDLRVYKGVAKYTSGFDVPKPYTPIGIESWRAIPDCTANNFATLNPLFNSASGDVVLADGNLTYAGSQTPSYGMTQGTIGVSTSKWYWEWRIGATAPNLGMGVIRKNNTTAYPGYTPETSFVSGVDGGIGFYHGVADAIYYWDGSNQTSVSYTIPACTTGDIVSVALDLDNGRIYYAKNGTWGGTNGNPATGTSPVGLTLSGTYLPAISIGAAGVSTAYANFGQNPTFSGNTAAGTYTDGNGKGLFKYQPPSGFLALCEDNLPTPAIVDPGEHFKTVLWTGDGNSGKSVTGLGFKPDLVWMKARHDSWVHGIYDSIRGPLDELSSDNTGAASIESDSLFSFNDDGFSYGTRVVGNQDGGIYVAGCWKAGGPAVLNDAGSIDSQVSVNQDAGFSIVNWTSNGATSVVTTGHGLAKTPKFMLLKNRDAVDNWFIYHESIQTNNRQYLQFTTDNTTTSPNDFWSVSSSTFGIRQSSIAQNGAEVIAYCWAEIEGYSKFGSYVGNADTDGPFVYCGFKPAWVMVKNTVTDSTLWLIADSSRFSTNPINSYLHAESSADEYGPLNGDSAYTWIDFLSNGFKLRQTGDSLNRNGETIIFAAFAESPFQTANAK